jgi:hypothetical protein
MNTQSTCESIKDESLGESIQRHRNEFMLTMELLCGSDRQWAQLQKVFDAAFNRLLITRLNDAELRVVRRRVIDILDRLYKHGPHWEPIKSQFFATFGKDGLQKLVS